MSDSSPSPAGDCTVVIFGATGDLARRKLLPALVNLAGRGALPARFTVLGVGRTPMSDEAYRQRIAQGFEDLGSGPADPALWAWLEPRLFYAYETLDTVASYESLSDRLDALDGAQARPAGRLFYLATPPDAMADIVLRLSAVGLLNEQPDAWRRVVFEKPFGHDLASALALNRQLAFDLAESQIYRIDHYLGKETVQNLLALRFGNGLFEPVWNRRYIDHVQITVAETVGVEDRGGYYDRSGALRDMVQNHLFQLLALTAMEPPISFSAEAVRDERVKVLHAIHPFTEAGVRADVVRGQYGPGTWNGRPFPGTVRKRRCHPGRQPRPTSPSGSRSTTGASRACRSTSGPASGCPRACPRSRSSSTGRRCACSSGPAPASSNRTCCSCASSRTRASRCSSRPRCRERTCASAR